MVEKNLAAGFENMALNQLKENVAPMMIAAKITERRNLFCTCQNCLFLS